jgi:hypothetical protein
LLKSSCCRDTREEEGRKSCGGREDGRVCDSREEGRGTADGVGRDERKGIELAKECGRGREGTRRKGCAGAVTSHDTKARSSADIGRSMRKRRSCGRGGEGEA